MSAGTTPKKESMHTKGPIPTPPDLEAIRRLHYPCCTVVTAGCQCMACVEPWPCSLSLVFALVDEQARRIEQLRKFAQTIFAGWPECGVDMDGIELQEAGVEAGLLRPETRTEACGDECNCADYHGAFPVTCYRKTVLLTGQAEAERDARDVLKGENG